MPGNTEQEIDEILDDICSASFLAELPEDLDHLIPANSLAAQLTSAVSNNSCPQIEECLNAGANVDHILPAELDNLSLLFWCATRSLTHLVKRLLAAGANTEYMPLDGQYKDMTVLYYAANEYIPEIICLLLDAGANTAVMCPRLNYNTIAMLLELKSSSACKEDKRFAIISNDHAASGSGLEGMRAYENCNFLLELRTKPNLDPTVVQFLNTAADNIEMIRQTDLLLINHKKPLEVRHRDYVNHLTNALLLVRQDLATKNTIAFSSGWTGLTSGHSIICEIRVFETTVLIILHNSGGGLNNHAHIQYGNRGYFANALAYKIDYSPSEFKHLASRICLILAKPKFQLLAKNIADPVSNLYYNYLSTQLALVGAKEIDINDINFSFVKGQRSGTCAWKSLSTWLKNSLSREQFFKVKFAIKKEILSDYFRTQKTLDRLNVHFVNHQLRNAVENLARLMLKMQKLIPINDIYNFEQTLNLLDEISSTIAIPAVTPVLQNVPDELHFVKCSWQNLIATPDNKQTVTTTTDLTFEQEFASAVVGDGALAEAETLIEPQTLTLEPKIPAGKILAFNPTHILEYFTEMTNIARDETITELQRIAVIELNILAIPLNFPSEQLAKYNQHTAQRLIDIVQKIFELDVYHFGLTTSNTNKTLMSENILVMIKLRYILTVITSHLSSKILESKNTNLIECYSNYLSDPHMSDSNYKLFIDGANEYVLEDIKSYYCTQLKSLPRKRKLKATTLDAAGAVANNVVDHNGNPAVSDTESNESWQTAFVDLELKHISVEDAKNIWSKLLACKQMEADLIRDQHLDKNQVFNNLTDINKWLPIKNSVSIPESYYVQNQTVSTLTSTTRFDLALFPNTDLYNESLINSLSLKEPHWKTYKQVRHSKQIQAGKYVLEPGVGLFINTQDLIFGYGPQNTIYSSIDNRALTGTVNNEFVKLNLDLHRSAETEFVKTLLNLYKQHQSSVYQLILINDFIREYKTKFKLGCVRNMIYVKTFAYGTLNEVITRAPNLVSEFVQLLISCIELDIADQTLTDNSIFFAQLLVHISSHLKMHSLQFGKDILDIERSFNKIEQLKLNIADRYLTPNLYARFRIYLLRSKINQPEYKLSTNDVFDLIYMHSTQSNFSSDSKRYSDVVIVKKIVTELMIVFVNQVQAVLLELKNAKPDLLFGYLRELLGPLFGPEVALATNTMTLGDDFVVHITHNQLNYSLNLITGAHGNEHKIGISTAPSNIIQNSAYIKLFGKSQHQIYYDRKAKHYIQDSNGSEIFLNPTPDKLMISSVFNGNVFNLINNELTAVSAQAYNMPISIFNKSLNFWGIIQGDQSELIITKPFPQQNMQKQISTNAKDASMQVCSINSAGLVSKMLNNSKFYLLDITRSKNAYLQLLLRFESASYIEVWSTAYNRQIVDNKILVYLPRYNLNFLKAKNSLEFICAPFPNYILHPFKPEFMQRFEHYLYLKPKVGFEHLSDLMLVPIQKYLFDIEEAQMKFDLESKYIMLQHCKKVSQNFKVTTNNSYLKRFNENYYSSSPSSLYNNEKFCLITLENGKWCAINNSTSKLLFLCYVFLGSRNFTQAFAVFNDVREKLTGTKEEITGLTNLLLYQNDFIAFSPKELAVYRDNTEDSAEHLALKVHAILYLAKFNALPIIVDVGVSEPEVVNKHSRLYVTVISKYFKCLSNIPKTYRLSLEDEFAILHAAECENNKDSRYLAELKVKIEDQVYKQLENKITTPSITVKHKQDITTFKTPSPFSFQDADLKISNLRFHYQDQNIKPPSIESMAENTRPDDIFYLHPKIILLIANKFSTTADREATLFLLKNIIKHTCLNLSKSCILQYNSAQNPNTVQNLELASLLFLIYIFLQSSNTIPEDLKQIMISGFDPDISAADYLRDRLPTMIKILNLHQHMHSELFYIETHVNIVVASNHLVNTPALAQPLSVQMPDDYNFNIFAIHTQLGMRTEQINKFEPSNNLKSLLQEIEHDNIIGAARNSEKRQSHNMLLSSLNNPTTLSEIKHTTVKHLNELALLVNKLEQSLINLVNNVPLLEPDNYTNKLTILGKEILPLSLRDIINLFLANDLNNYSQKTLLKNEIEIRNIHQMIFEYLLFSTKLQYCERIMSLSVSAENTSDIVAKNQILIDLGLEINSNRSYDPRLHPELLIFEYRGKLLIRPEQYKYLSILTATNNGNYQNFVSQIKMGGGKTKLFLPYLAYLKADGKRLSMLMVTPEQLLTNYTDLSKISAEVFEQHIFLLSFSRSTKLNTNYFATLYYSLLNVIRQKNFVLTTPESIQSLYLTFIDYIFDNRQQAISKKSDVNYLRKILHLFSTCCDATIDEADKVFDVMKELNFTIGKKFPINEVYPDIISDMLDLYLFLEQNFQISEYISGQKAIKQLVEQKFTREVAQQLLAKNNPTLLRILQRTESDLNASQKNDIFEYLIDRSRALPSFLHGLTDENKDNLAVWRGNLSFLFYSTLSQQFNENYGLRPNSKFIAVPYIAANTYSVRSEYSSLLEQINYTIQNHLALDLREDVFKAVLEFFVSKYVISLDSTEDPRVVAENCLAIKQQAAELFGFNVNLHQIALSQPEPNVIANMYNTTKSSLALKIFALKHVILPNINISPLTLVSNTQTLARLLNTTQAFSGTLANYRTMTNFIPTFGSCEGIDGETVDNILNSTVNVHTQKQGQPIREVLFDAISGLDSHVFALIDQGAYFKQFTNSAVAILIKSLIDPTRISFVLFFDNDQLCAIPTNVTSNIIRIGSTDPIIIDKVLGVNSIGKRFFIYDQQRAFGTDLPLPANAEAILIIGPNTTLTELLQSAMRLRNLAKGQKLQFFVPNVLGDKINSVPAILQLAIDNQIAQLAHEHYIAAKRQIDATISACLRKLLLYKDRTLGEYRQILTDMQEFIFSPRNGSLFEVYGTALNAVAPIAELQRYAKAQLAAFTNCLKKKTLQDINEPASALINRVTLEVNAIVAAIGPVCSEDVYSPETYQSGQEQVSEQEQESLSELQTQSDQYNEMLTKAKSVRNHLGYQFDSLLLHKDEFKNFHMMSLNLITANSRRETGIEFDKNIYCTRNFAAIFSGAKDNMPDVPELHAIGILIDLKNKSTSYFLITDLDVKKIFEFMKDKDIDPNEYQLIVTNAQGILIAGTLDQEIFNSRAHLRRMEQIAFFNGDLRILLKSPDWIKENSANKLLYLKKAVLSKFVNKNSYIAKLENTINSINGATKPLMLAQFKALNFDNVFAKKYVRVRSQVTEEEEEASKPSASKKVKLADQVEASKPAAKRSRQAAQVEASKPATKRSRQAAQEPEQDTGKAKGIAPKL